MTREEIVQKMDELARKYVETQQTADVELLKVGEACKMAIPSQAQPKMLPAGKV
jgi:hypothetical protein